MVTRFLSECLQKTKECFELIFRVFYVYVLLTCRLIIIV